MEQLVASEAKMSIPRAGKHVDSAWKITSGYTVFVLKMKKIISVQQMGIMSGIIQGS